MSGYPDPYSLTHISAGHTLESYRRSKNIHTYMHMYISAFSHTHCHYQSSIINILYVHSKSCRSAMCVWYTKHTMHHFTWSWKAVLLLSMCLHLSWQAQNEVVCFPTSDDHSLIISVNRKTSTKQIALGISSTNKSIDFLFSPFLSATRFYFYLSLCLHDCICFHMHTVKTKRNEYFLSWQMS